MFDRTRHLITPLALTVLLAGCGGAKMSQRAQHAGHGGSSNSVHAGGAAGPMLASANATGGSGATTATRAGPGMSETMQLKEKLVIEGWLQVNVDDVRKAAEAITTEVKNAGGRVITEQVSGGETSWTAHLRLRVPPTRVAGFMDFIASIGEITSKRIQGTDVSRKLFDQELALENLTRTLHRLRKLLDREGLEMKDVLQIEREMTRLRGQIERIKGDQRFLKDRVSLATLDINLRRSEGAILGPKAKFYPGVRMSTLTLLDRSGRKRTRFGVGAVVHTVQPLKGRATIELDVFEDADNTGSSLIVSVGGATYSDFLGRGRREYLNPYLGFRLGYAYLDGSAFAFAGTAGVELFKHKYFLIDANVRLYGLVSDGFEAAVVAGGGATFAF